MSSIILSYNFFFNILVVLIIAHSFWETYDIYKICLKLYGLTLIIACSCKKETIIIYLIVILEWFNLESCNLLRDNCRSLDSQSSWEWQAKKFYNFLIFSFPNVLIWNSGKLWEILADIWIPSQAGNERQKKNLTYFLILLFRMILAGMIDIF